MPGKLRSPFGPKEEKERERIIPGKLRDDRFGDMGRRADDGDNDRIPGKLKPFEGPKQGDGGKNVKFPGKLRSPFDDRGDEGDGGDNSRVPGKLRSPSEDGTKPRDGSFKGPQRNRGTTRRRKTEGKKASPEDYDENMVDNEEITNPENELQDKNKLLTYISLATEPEEFRNVFTNAQPEICRFFNNLNSTYKPTIDKILQDKQEKIDDLNNKVLSGKIEKGDNPTVLEPFNINSLPEKEKYDSGIVLS